MVETQAVTEHSASKSEPKTYQNYINGVWQAAKSGKTFQSLNPANPSDVVGLFAASGKEDVDLAVAAAKKAYESWRLFPAPKRAEILYRAGQIFVERKEELARELTREMGKVIAEARGDVQEVIDMVFYAAGEGRRLFGQTTPSELRNKFAMSVRVPLGVVGCITPWNFPMAIPSWKIAPALVCGNTVVFKPASDTPLVALRFVEVFEEAGLPPGVLNFVTRRRRCRRGRDAGSPGCEAGPPLPAPVMWAVMSTKNAPRPSNGSPWKWAAKMPPSFWKTLTWIWRSMVSCGARSGRRDSGVPRPAG